MSAAAKLVVFDVDGTLIDSQDFIVEAMGRAFGDLGVPLPARAQVLSIVGLSLDRAIARLMPDLSPGAVREAAQRYKDAFIALRDERGGEATSPMYPGAFETLAALHARGDIRLGVATGKARRGLDHATCAHGLDRFFVTRQTSDQHPSKPHPAMLQAALEETGTAPGAAVMIGDTSFDVEMGRAAGVATIGVAWGYHPSAELERVGADRVIADFSDLIPTLDALLGGAR